MLLVLFLRFIYHHPSLLPHGTAQLLSIGCKWLANVVVVEWADHTKLLGEVPCQRLVHVPSFCFLGGRMDDFVHVVREYSGVWNIWAVANKLRRVLFLYVFYEPTYLADPLVFWYGSWKLSSRGWNNLWENFQPKIKISLVKSCDQHNCFFGKFSIRDKKTFPQIGFYILLHKYLFTYSLRTHKGSPLGQCVSQTLGI